MDVLRSLEVQSALDDVVLTANARFAQGIAIQAAYTGPQGRFSLAAGQVRARRGC